MRRAFRYRGVDSVWPSENVEPYSTLWARLASAIDITDGFTALARFQPEFMDTVSPPHAFIPPSKA